MLTLSQLEDTSSFICAYFLGKWDVDKSVRLIPALELHMPPTLRSHTKKQNAGHRQVDDGTGAKGEKRNCTQATLDGDDIPSKQKKARRPVSKVVTKSAKLVSSHSPFSAQTVRKDIVFKICSPAGRTRKARAVGLDANASLMNESRYNLRESGKKCVNSKKLNESVNCSDRNHYRDKGNNKLNCKSRYEVKSTPILAKSGQQKKSVGELSKATRNKRKAQILQMRNCSVVVQNIQTVNEKVYSTLHGKISKVSRGVNAEEQKCTKLNDKKTADESDTHITSKGPVEMRNCKVSLDNCLPNMKTQFRSDRENTHSETTTCQKTTDSLITDSDKTEDIEGKVLKPANILLETQSKRNGPARGVKRSFSYCDKENIESPKNERRIRRNRTVVIDYSQTKSELEWLDAQLEKTFATGKTKCDDDDDDSWTANSKTKPRSAKDKDITRQEKKHKKNEDKEKQKMSKEKRKELECGDNNSSRRVTKRKEKENKTSQQKREKPSKNKEKLDDGKNSVAIEDCSVTAKPGTLKYLKQVNSLTDACAKVEEAEDDFFGSEFGKKKKTNGLQNLLLMPASHDDSFTIKTPKGKTQGSDVITPRTNLLGMWETATTPSAVTPSTSSPNPTNKAAHKKDTLEVMFRHMQDRKGRPRGIRKALQNNKASESILEDVRQLPPVELPKLPEIPDMSGESSCDEYFNTSNG